MNETIDHLIQTRFDAVASNVDQRDWSDVLARARIRRSALRPRRLTLVTAAVAVALATTAVAAGWPGKVVDFFTAPPAPESVAKFFHTFNEMVPPGMNDSTVGQPREVMTATFDANHAPPTDPTEHTLYVAPRDGGGFCFIWTEDSGSCAEPLDTTPATTNTPRPPGGDRPLGVVWLEGDYVTVVNGYVRGDVQTVEARFGDGSSVTLPITWVSAPIDAGFFVYVVPPAHQTVSDALMSIVALDANANVVEQDDVGVTKPLDQDAPQTLPDGTKVSLPRRAQAADAREAFSFRTASGDHAYLWVMPRTGGGTCYLYGTGSGGGGGCPSPHWLSVEPAIDGSEYGGDVYFAQVKPSVAALELRYANGTSERVTPVDGYLLAQMTPGAQLVAVVALDSSGKAIFTQQQQKGP